MAGGDTTTPMQSHQRTFLIVLIVLLVLAGVGAMLTNDRGNRSVSVSNRLPSAAQSPVDMRALQTARTLAALATGADEQGLARDALRLADHEIDLAFTAALYQAASQPPPSNPQIRAILERIAAAEKQVADGDADVARFTKLLATARDNEKRAVSQQLELAKARQELNEYELADADRDLAGAGGDPQSRIQQMVDEHNSAEHDSGGEMDTGTVGSQAGSRVPASNSFLSRARVWYAIRSDLGRLGQAQQEASAAAAAFSSRHDDLERQLTQALSLQSKTQANVPSGNIGGVGSGPIPSPKPEEADATLSSIRSLSAAQKRIARLDSQIRDDQDLANVYGQWSALVAVRQRRLLHGLLVSLMWMLLIALAVFAFNRSTEHFFKRLAPDRKRLLTLHTVVRIAARAAGVGLILLVVFGPPGQMATVLALAGAGLTVALKDFIVGFFGWFVLMGKNGIRHGDWVEINGVSGEVVEIGLFHTVLLETGNWNNSGHPTGRRVTFVNSYAIEGHYFNFSTSGQWLWDELQIALPADQDPYEIANEMQKIVTKETEANARLAEQEWARVDNTRGTRAFSAGPAISVRPSNLGYEILVRYVTRANERHQQRSRLYQDIVELLRQRNIPQPAAPSPAPSPAAESA
jgi:small-conductance mechanosensitive channel